MKTSKPTRSKLPHVALLVETSLASGRDILLGIARYMRERGTWSVYHEPRSLEDRPPSWLAKWKGQGIIARFQNSELAEAIVATGIPVVDVLGVYRHPDVPLVHVDNAAIARQAAEHLLERGFTRFAYVGIRGVNWSDQRRDAFLETIRQAGHECDLYELTSAIRSDSSWEAEQDRLARWLLEIPKPCGVMACNDPRGQRVLEAARRIGVSVPEQLAVVGVDNDEPLCQIADPPLSSVRADHTLVGFEAAALLDRMMRGQKLSDHTLLVQPLGVAPRRSTDTLALNDDELARALRFIRLHACEDIGVEDVVAQTTLSRSVLQRRFKDLLKRTVHDEIIRLRLQRARELLADTDLPIVTVAERAGFKHQEYLGAVFRTFEETTPLKFRRKSRGV